jgi:hypothetical protein
MSTTKPNVPIDRKVARDTYWQEVRDCSDKIKTLIQVLADTDNFVITPDEAADLVGTWTDDPDYEVVNLRTIEAFEQLEKLGVISREEAYGHGGKTLIRIHRPVAEWIEENLGGFPTKPTGRAEGVVNYVGSVLKLPDQRPDPTSAWIYAVTRERVKLVNPSIEVRKFGAPDRDDEQWLEEFPLQEYLKDAWADNYDEYVIDIEIEAQFLTIDRLAEFQASVEPQIASLIASSLYRDYQNFSLSAIQAELTELSEESVHSDEIDVVDTALVTHLEPDEENNRILLAGYFKDS